MSEYNPSHQRLPIQPAHRQHTAQNQQYQHYNQNKQQMGNPMYHQHTSSTMGDTPPTTSTAGNVDDLSTLPFTNGAVPNGSYPQEVMGVYVPPDSLPPGHLTKLDYFNRYTFAPMNPHYFIDPYHRRYELLCMIRYAEMGERYHDMAVLSRHLVMTTKGCLSREERVYFIVAHNHLFTQQKQAIDRISVKYHSPYTNHMYTYYKQILIHEYKTTLLQTIKFCEKRLLNPSNDLMIHRIHVMKFVADLKARLAEVNPIEGTYAAEALSAYSHVALTAELCVPISSPIRLGLLLNYAIAIYKLYRDATTALNLARSAFESAIKIIDKLDDEDYSDSVLVLQLLKDNIALWSNSDLSPKSICPMVVGLDYQRLHNGTIPKQRQYTPPPLPQDLIDFQQQQHHQQQLEQQQAQQQQQQQQQHTQKHKQMQQRMDQQHLQHQKQQHQKQQPQMQQQYNQATQHPVGQSYHQQLHSQQHHQQQAPSQHQYHQQHQQQQHHHHQSQQPQQNSHYPPLHPQYQQHHQQHQQHQHHQHQHQHQQQHQSSQSRPQSQYYQQ